MVAGRRRRRNGGERDGADADQGRETRVSGSNFGAAADRGDTARIVDAASPLLALRLAGQDHALEPGRDYILGSSKSCDLQLPSAAAPRHAQITVTNGGVTLVDLGSPAGTTHNFLRIASAVVAVGDVLGFGDGIAEAIVVHDDGNAAIVPLPADRAAAAMRRVAVASTQLQVQRRLDEGSFQDVVAHELRRAPWLALSAFVHVAILLLFWLFAPRHTISGDAPATVNIDVAGELPATLTGPPEPPEVLIEPAETAPLASTEQPPAAKTDADVPVDEGPTLRAEMPLANAKLGPRQAPTDSSQARGTNPDFGGSGSGGFQRTVSELRRSGLEIVFVFDSTGSMARTIDDTKSTIAQMLGVLRALIPDARIGLVTYRDHGAREEYLTRQVPLGIDFWRATNFVQFVSAAGGGDRPEDVRSGLRAAFEQAWRSGARRVVVLAGDAPPHAEDLSRLLTEVRSFTQDGRSFVHTLVTTPDRAGTDTHDTFDKIAHAGRGTCQRLETHHRVLQEVLTLAFGREFDQDLAGIIAAVAHEQQRVDVQALDLARRGGPELTKALRQTPVPMPLWNALVRRPRRVVVEQLVDVLAASETNMSTRQAVAAALQRILELPLPPIDPVDPAAPTAAVIGRLRQQCRQLAD